MAIWLYLHLMSIYRFHIFVYFLGWSFFFLVVFWGIFFLIACCCCCRGAVVWWLKWLRCRSYCTWAAYTCLFIAYSILKLNPGIHFCTVFCSTSKKCFMEEGGGMWRIHKGKWRLCSHVWNWWTVSEWTLIAPAAKVALLITVSVTRCHSVHSFSCNQFFQ